MPEAGQKSRFLAFAEKFDAFFFDQYGVLHNGRRPYPGALETLSRLKARGAKIVVLSNSGRSGEENAARMERFGFFPAPTMTRSSPLATLRASCSRAIIRRSTSLR